MRHQVAGRHLSRTSAHRRALRRNLAASLFEHGTISTTVEKAKFVKPFAEKLITLAKKGTLHARRRAIALLQDRDICTVEDGEPVKVDTVIKRLFSEVAPRFADRNGGYTRIIRLPWRRIGDNGKLVLLQLLGQEETATSTKAGEATSKADTTQEQPQSTATPAQEEKAQDEAADSESPKE